MTRLIRYLRVPPPRLSSGLVRQVYRQMAPENAGVHAPFQVHSPHPALLAAVWAMFRETQLAGRVPRGEKEVVAYGVARLNDCPWCADAHEIGMRGASRFGVPDRWVASEWSDPGGARPPDAKYRLLLDWTRATRTPGAPELRSPPFPAQDAAEYVGAVVLWNYLNRVANVLLVDSPLPRQRWLRGAWVRLLGYVFGRWFLRRAFTPGTSLRLTEAAQLPADLAWAAGDANLARAFAAVAATTEEAARRHLTPETMRVVRSRVQAWRGEDPGLGRAWLTRAVAGLSPDEQGAARLALLSALASYQVDEDTVQAFRRHAPSDEALVAVVAWSSFTAARRVGSWLLPDAITARPAAEDMAARGVP